MNKEHAKIAQQTRVPGFLVDASIPAAVNISYYHHTSLTTNIPKKFKNKIPEILLGRTSIGRHIVRVTEDVRRFGNLH